MKALSLPTKIIFLIISVKCMNVTNIINNPNPDLVADLEDTFIKLYDENHLRYNISALLKDADWRRIRCEISSESFLKRISVCDWIKIVRSKQIYNQEICFESVEHRSVQTDLLYCEVICLKDSSWEVLKLYFAGGYQRDDDGDLFMYILKPIVIADEATTGVDDWNSSANPTPSTTSDDTFNTAEASNIIEPSISVVTGLITDSISSTSILNFSSSPGSEISRPSFQNWSADFTSYPFSGTLQTANTTTVSRGQNLNTDFKSGSFSGISSTANTSSEPSASRGQTSNADLVSDENLSANLAYDLSSSTPQILNISEPSLMPTSVFLNTDLVSSNTSNSTSSIANVSSLTAPVQSISSTADMNSSILLSLIRGLVLAPNRKIPTVNLVTLTPQTIETVNIKYSIIGQVARSF